MHNCTVRWTFWEVGADNSFIREKEQLQLKTTNFFCCVSHMKTLKRLVFKMKTYLPPPFPYSPDILFNHPNKLFCVSLQLGTKEGYLTKQGKIVKVSNLKVVLLFFSPYALKIKHVKEQCLKIALSMCEQNRIWNTCLYNIQQSLYG